MYSLVTTFNNTICITRFKVGERNKMEETIDPWYNMNESQNNYAEWKKPKKVCTTLLHLHKILGNAK